MAIYQAKAILLVDSQIEFVEKQILAGQCATVPKEEDIPILQWKAEPMKLVELLYAAHSDGNFGAITLHDVFASKPFGCDIKNHYRLFWSIKNRTNATKFLDKLKLALIKKIEASDEK